tara:strand:+ start:1694 stop:2113 length:420 start_codon:yes stop_codon:yes gene_type:complete
MAHFAKLDSNNIVTEVLVVKNDILKNESNQEQESLGINFLKSTFGSDTIWVQTSYNNKIRSKFAGTGDFYDSENDVFYSEKPFDSWTLNETTWEWEAPKPYPITYPENPPDVNAEDYNPDLYKIYDWDEEKQKWVELTE